MRKVYKVVRVKHARRMVSARVGLFDPEQGTLCATYTLNQPTIPGAPTKLFAFATLKAAKRFVASQEWRGALVCILRCTAEVVKVEQYGFVSCRQTAQAMIDAWRAGHPCGVVPDGTCFCSSITPLAYAAKKEVPGLGRIQ